MADRLVDIRVSGEPAAVEEIAQRLRRALVVAKESADIPNRRDPGVRRYLTILVEGRRDG